MKVIRIVVAFGILCMVVTIQVTGQSDADARLEELLARQVSIPLERHETVTTAFMNVLVRAGAPGGIVTVSDCSEDVRYGFPVGANSLRETLTMISSVDPTKHWQVKDGVINLLPADEIPDLLSVRIAEFDLEDTRAPLYALDRLLNLPEVRDAIAQLHLEQLRIGIGLVDLKKPGSTQDEAQPLFSVHCKGSTFRGVLNGIARAHGYAVWAYDERHCNGKDQFKVDFIVR